MVERADAMVKRRMLARRAGDLTINWILRSEDPRQFQYPQLYLSHISEWIRQTEVKVTIIKSLEKGNDAAGIRFQTLLDEIASSLPFAPLSLAREAGVLADSVLGRTDVVAYSTWAADVGFHFFVGSSLGHKGRLLYSILRFSRAHSYLELGTAYGMSALVAARTLQMIGPGGSVTTVEALQQQYDIATSILRSRLGEMVDWRLGYSKQCLEELSREGKSFDFLFHDAAHSYDDYINDFALAEPMLKTGAVCLIDDIRWDDSRYPTNSGRCYDGWKKVASHHRVIAAAELDGSMGILLLR